MMRTESFERQLVAFLLGLPELTSVVGNRLYPVTLDYSKPFPAATYLVTSNMPEARTQEGHAGYVSSRVQLDLWDRNYLVITDAAHAIRNAIDGHTVTLGYGVNQRRATFYSAGDNDDYNEKTQTFYRHLDYLVHHDS